MDTPTPQPPPVDPEVIEMLASLQEPGEPDLLNELILLFLRDTPERLHELRQRPIGAGSAARVAHAVKGSAGNLGATRLQDLAGQLERAGHGGAAAEELAAMADALFVEYAAVERYLQMMVDGRTGNASAALA